MTSSDASVPTSASSAEGAVLVTGIVGNLGKLVCRMFHREFPVIGVDRRDFVDKPKDVTFHQVDIRRKKMRDILRHGGVRAVVHLGIMHDPRSSADEHHAWNVVAFSKMLESMELYGVPKLIVLSSANAYGPNPDNAQFLSENAPLLGSAHFHEIRDLVEVDMLAQSFFWRNASTETVILRPVHILGPVRNAPSNYLRLPVVPTLMGFDPMVQVIHHADVARAIRLALNPGVRGIFNIAGPAPVSLSKLISTAGRPSIPVPHGLAKSMLGRAWRWRLSDFPAPELDHIKYVCMVDDRRARERMGWSPSYGLRDAVLSLED